MTTAASTASHTIRVIGISNGGGKARRAVCSCGYLGTRFHYYPHTFKAAQAKAEATGAEHLAGRR